MDEDIFDGEFVPPGWLPPYAPAEAEELYLSAVVPACRACHMQQDRSLDFATYEGFMVFEDAHKELVLSSAQKKPDTCSRYPAFFSSNFPVQFH